MERSRMPDNTSSASAPVHLLSVALPEVAPDFSGTWPERAICAGEDPSIFFPSHGDPGIRARRVCADCPVQMDCLEYAIAADEWGIWGGLDRDQRRALHDDADEPALPSGHAIVRDENRERA
jgi:WhiB family transcriptional regulator, redox-sensing transcriptional regulator